MGISEATLSLAIDSGVNDAVMLLACLTLLGFCTTEAMHATRDAVRAGLVKHA